MVPEGWIKGFLGNICEGNLQTGPFGSQLHAHEYIDDERGIAVVMPKILVLNRIRYSVADKISQSRADDLEKHKLRSGDIVFSRRGDVARTAIVEDGDPLAICGTGCLRARPGPTADSNFLNYFFGQGHVGYWLESNAVGQTMLNLNTSIISGLPIQLPPLPEQRKIAEILSTWDRAIEVSEALLATARTQKRSLMQSILTGKHRFPEFEGQPWKEVRLGDVGETVSGGTPSSTVPEYWNGDVQWATPTDITKLKSRFIKSTARMITQAGLKSSSAKLVPAGSILICTRATIGEMAIATGPISTNQGFKNLVLNDDFDGEFIFYLLQFFKNDLIRYACGSTFLELSKADFVKRSFMMPELSEQKRIAGVINAAEAEIETHQQDIEILRTEKCALMQQLLTGKRRVAV